MKEQKSIVPWHKAKTVNYFMPKKHEAKPDYLDKFIIKGWAPDKPFITKETLITTFGSCFARSVSNYLAFRGYTVGNNLKDKSLEYIRDVKNIHVIDYADAFNNTFVIRQQFEWAFNNKQFYDDLWYNNDGEFVGYDLKTQEATKNIFLNTDVFILTMGLSEVWYHKESGDVFWRTMPEDKYDADIHGFRVSTVQENYDNLVAIYEIIKQHRPSAKLIMTLSPVPLYATFRPVSCVTANTVSKAILRSAIDQVYRDHESDPNLFYWPSYEIVGHHGKKAFGDDNRHVQTEVVQGIMEKFTKYYCI